MDPLGLESLLSALRHAGLRVGAAEMLRIHQVISTVPRGSDGRPGNERLRAILRAIVAKSEADQEVFDEIYGVWYGRAERDAEVREAQYQAMQAARLAHEHRAAKRAADAASHRPNLDDLAAAEDGRMSGPKRTYTAVAVLLGAATLIAALIWLAIPRDQAPDQMSQAIPATPASIPNAQTEPLAPQPSQAGDTTTDQKSDVRRLETEVPAGGTNKRSTVMADAPATGVTTGPVAEEEKSAAVTTETTEKAPTEVPLATSFTAYGPYLTVHQAEFPWVWLFLALGIGIAGFEVWRRKRSPPPIAHSILPPPRPGPSRVFLDPSKPTEPQFIDREQQSALVWSIEKYVTDEPTRRIDLKATVAATAGAGGIPHLVHERARYLREVWIWCDESARSSTVTRVGDELADVLTAHGLPVERVLFHGVPVRLTHLQGNQITLEELDDRRDNALVCIFTDGALLVRQHQYHNVRRREIDALLRDLSHWPRLAFVDMTATGSHGRYEEQRAVSEYLHRLLARHELRIIRPWELDVFMSGSTHTEELGNERPNVAQWAGACALAPAPVDEDTVLALHRALELDVSPLALAALRHEAPGPGGRLHWKGPTRIRRVNWLSAAQGRNHSPAAAAPLFDRALDFWLERYEDMLENALEQPWRDTLAHQRLCMEHALLRLWHQPGPAIETLHRLHQGPLAQSIEAHLEILVPAPEPDDELPFDDQRIQLPWTWASRSASERICLIEMKLGGERPREMIRAGGRLWLGLGICLAVAIAAMGSFAWRASALLREPTIEISGYAPSDARVAMESRDTWTWQVMASDPWMAKDMRVGRGDRVIATWRTTTVPCQSEYQQARILRCGTTEPRLGAVNPGVLVLDTGEMSSDELERSGKLAHAALDCQHAGIAYLGTSWHEDNAQSLGYALDHEIRIAGMENADTLDDLELALGEKSACRSALFRHGLLTELVERQSESEVISSPLPISPDVQELLRARVTFVQGARGGGSHIIVNRGENTGLFRGARGYLVTRKGERIPRGNFQTVSCTRFECRASVALSTDAVTQAGYIVAWNADRPSIERSPVVLSTRVVFAQATPISRIRVIINAGEIQGINLGMGGSLIDSNGARIPGSDFSITEVTNYESRANLNVTLDQVRSTPYVRFER